MGNLFPGYFALVMATGIVSIECSLAGLQTIAMLLLGINVAAYVSLAVLTAIRIARYRAQLLADVIDHIRGPGFFTMVSATCVLGAELLIVTDARRAAFALWWVGAALWLVVTYTFFTAVTVRENKPALDSGINGAWLLAIVATQSLSFLTTLLASRAADHTQALLFAALCLSFTGCMLYIIIITLIVYRFTFYRLTMAALTPPYWINMGAVAITALASSVLILNATRWSLLQELLPFLKGQTLFFWAAATWWIPLLVVLGVWRHVIRRFPLQYDPQYWGMVFPIGMYAVCTLRISEALDMPWLLHISRFAMAIALLAWMAAFAGMLIDLARFGTRRKAG